MSGEPTIIVTTHLNGYVVTQGQLVSVIGKENNNGNWKWLIGSVIGCESIGTPLLKINAIVADGHRHSGYINIIPEHVSFIGDDTFAEDLEAALEHGTRTIADGMRQPVLEYITDKLKGEQHE